MNELASGDGCYLPTGSSWSLKNTYRVSMLDLNSHGHRESFSVMKGDSDVGTKVGQSCEVVLMKRVDVS